MQSAQAWVQNLVSIASVKPEALDHIDVDALADYIADVTSVPHQVRTDDETIAQARKSRAEQEQRQQTLNEYEQQANIANRAAPAVETLSEIPLGSF